MEQKNIDSDKGRGRKTKKIRDENLWPREISGRNLLKTDKFGGPGKVARRGHCESYKHTEAAMVRAHKKTKEEKVVMKVTEWKPDFKRARGRPKSR